MWDEKYVVSVEHPKVKVDNYIVSNIEKMDNQEYEFIFQYDTDLKKLKELNTKEMLVKTYNLGKFVNEKFTFDGFIEVVDKNTNKRVPKIIKNNIFLKAREETHLEYFGRLKSISKQVEKKLNIDIKVDKYDSDKREAYNDELRKIEKEIYVRRVEGQFKLYNVQDEDYNKLLELLNDWIKTCGLTERDVDLTEKQQNIFPIILLSHQIYLFIENGLPHLEAKFTQTMSEDYHFEMNFDTVNDLIYSLAMNYFIFDRNGYIICEVCGLMHEGNRKKKTCSEVCKKKRNGSYNKKN